MKIFAILFFSLLPNIVFAACTQGGTTVVYINGIFTTSSEAATDLGELQSKYIEKTGDSKTKFINGYNPSHFEGLGDLVQSVFQTFFSSASDFDRDTILMQIYPEVKTRKLLLLGHSQGSFYSNGIYDYLLNHGEPKRSVGVYNVASPASYTAGGGLYLTAKQDTVITWVASMTKIVGGLPPLGPNTDLPLTIKQALETYPGHSFAGYYLQNSGSRIASDLQFALKRLTAELPLDNDGCFTPPENSLGRKTSTALFVVGDFYSDAIASAAVQDYKYAVATVGGVRVAIGAVGSVFSSVASAFVPAPRTTNLPRSHDIVGALYGSSVTEENLREFGLLEDQGGAVALAAQETPVQPGVESDMRDGVVLGAETESPATPSFVTPPQALGLPPMYSVGGGGSAGFGGGGSSGAAPAPAQDDPAPPPVTTESATTTATTTETATEVATSTATTTSTTLYEQLDASTLGETNDVQGTQANPTQKLGTGLSGLAGSVAYRLHGNDLASTTAGISAGFGDVLLYSCFSGSYIACGNPKASSDFHPQILSQSGDDATILVDMTGSAYSFDPAQYYYLMWVTAGDMAIYGSAGDAYANGVAQWFDGAFAPDTNISDVAFRICNTAQCVLP